MTRDDIIRMAREAGIDAESDTLCRYEGWFHPLAHFATLARAAGEQAERERTKRLVEDMQAELYQRRMTGRNT